MKLNLVFVGAVFGEQCYEVGISGHFVGHKTEPHCIQGLLNEAKSVERSSSSNIAEALTNFGACVERDINLDTADFISSNEEVFNKAGGPPEGCIKSFIERVYECIPIQEDHPFCNEDNPNFNGFMCALKLNQCLINSLTGIADDCT